MKYFISQPMRNRTEKEIKMERNQIIDDIKRVDPSAVIIDSMIAEEAPTVREKRVWYLGQSISLLADADVVVDATPVNSKWSSGCKVEMVTAKEYGIPTWIWEPEAIYIPNYNDNDGWEKVYANT